MSSKFVVKLLRGGEDVSTMYDATFDCIEEPVFSRPSFMETENEVKVSHSRIQEYESEQEG